MWRISWLVLGLMMGCGGERSYPNRPIELVCPWAAGGGTDRTSRQVAYLLERELGVPVTVVNATGGAGVTGHSRGALARPDGYTLTMITPELCMFHWRGLTSLTHRDFRPLGLMGRDDAAVFVRADAPWKTVGELAEAIRNAPGTLKASGTNQGGIWHVAAVGWLTAAGFRGDELIWVSIAGAAPSMQELIAGGVDLVCCSYPEARALLDAGKVRCLTVMADQRNPNLKDVPTLKEGGVDWSLRSFKGVAAPADLPDERAGRLETVLEAVSASPEYREFMEQNGFGDDSATGAEFARLADDFDRRMGEVLTSEAFKQTRRPPLGPWGFPAALAVGIVLLAARPVWTSGLWRARPAMTEAPGMVAGVSVVAGVLAAVIASEYVGFLLAATLLMIGLMRALGTSWRVALAASLPLVALVYLAFGVGLRVQLPLGSIFA